MWFLLVPLTAYVGSSVLPTIGFTTADVVGGSIAAVWQSCIGNVAVGRLPVAVNLLRFNLRMQLVLET